MYSTIFKVSRFLIHIGYTENVTFKLTQYH